MTIRKSALHDRRARDLAWYTIVVIIGLILGSIFLMGYIFYDPWPPSGISEGVDP